MSEPLHLAKVPLRPERVVALARQRRLPLHQLDEGYLCHSVLRELWQGLAPAPFVTRDHRHTLEVWGYTSVEATTLIAHARDFGDPSLLAAIGGLSAIVSKPIPRFDPGRRVGFLLRTCPVVRLGRGTMSHQPGAEVDAFLARCATAGAGTFVSRESVYREWLSARLDCPEVSGAALTSLRIASMSRERVIRRTQGLERRARVLERPDVRFEGDLTIVDSDRFTQWLARGVGRHRAFGFGALILVPPGTQHAN